MSPTLHLPAHIAKTAVAESNKSSVDFVEVKISFHQTRLQIFAAVLMSSGANSAMHRCYYVCSVAQRRRGFNRSGFATCVRLTSYLKKKRDAYLVPEYWFGGGVRRSDPHQAVAVDQNVAGSKRAGGNAWNKKPTGRLIIRCKNWESKGDFLCLCLSRRARETDVRARGKKSERAPLMMCEGWNFPLFRIQWAILEPLEPKNGGAARATHSTHGRIFNISALRGKKSAAAATIQGILQGCFALILTSFPLSFNPPLLTF